MSISGLVITLCEDGDRADDARRALARDARLELGRCDGRRLAAVTDTPSPRADRALWESLWSTPGVTHVDVVYVGLDDPPAPADHPTATAAQQEPPS